MPACHEKRWLRLAIGAWAVLGATATALSADLGSGPPPVREEQALPRPWTLSFTPYGWLPGLNGSTTVRGRTTDIDADPIEVVDHIHGLPWMSYAEARNGRFSLYNDIVYAPLGVGGSATRSFDRTSVGATLGVDIRQTIVEAGATYELGRWWSGGTSGLVPLAGYTAIDLLAGARYWRQDVDINLALTGTLDVAGLTLSRTRAIARAGDVDWVDPLVGLRLRHQLAPGQELVLRGDIGGFDVGSQFSWNALAAYSFQIGTYYGMTYSGVIGYRALSVDFEKGSGVSRYEYDVIQHGPLVGLTVSF
jgi:hypothetical protein